MKRKNQKERKQDKKKQHRRRRETEQEQNHKKKINVHTQTLITKASHTPKPNKLYDLQKATAEKPQQKRTQPKDS
ncbi:hypothetical protein HYE18_02605 [Mycoplasmopsis bovis]|nr:hypothetical protein [Mycoplasmopsis bovis]QQH25102.1 hypothetical protein HYE18_02605 [Mycoplasmopsis bovis]